MSYYNDIEDMPIYNWRKCLSGQLIFTRSDKSGKGQSHAKDVEAWDKIQDSHIRIFGIDPRTKMIMGLQKELALCQLKYVETEERFLLNDIQRLQRELNEEVTIKDGNFEKTKLYLSKWLGYQVNEREITVLAFETAIREYVEANKEN